MILMYQEGQMSMRPGQPKILYRIFGNQLPKDLLTITGFPYQTERFTLLTTTDYPKNNIENLKEMGFNILPPTLSNEEAGKNAGRFLNQGLNYLKERGEKYALLMASGFQGSLGFVNNVFDSALQEHPNKDVYFALTPSINGPIKDLAKPSYQHEPFPLPEGRVVNLMGINGSFNLYENRKSFFPSESLAMVKIDSIFPLDEQFSEKGFLGIGKDGNPLGGIELLMTLLKKYKNEGITLDMCGLIAPIERNIGFRPFEFGPGSGGEEGPAVVEYTPNEVKIARRETTIDAALSKLALDEHEYEEIFDKTELVDASLGGEGYIFGLPSKT
jgi:hypothetical protein